MTKTHKDLLTEILDYAMVDYYRSKAGNAIVIPKICAFEFASTDVLLGVESVADLNDGFDAEAHYDGTRFPVKFKPDAPPKPASVFD